ncbi:hypothetical protein [Xanthomarina spongicola]|uniref:VWFA domain-containing protein n=1 Tax=Xanthomarina spongicola TaxID=570520 RepID=A0A316E6J6_9FLAO|nr:hypothetical protein [Xanthomarina spongicola]PWK18570.1 hypothetical protein LX78_01877 [Xanthomarina spongicola]
MKKNIIILWLSFIVLCSCKRDKELESSEKLQPEYTMIKLSGDRPNLNISILLDLSDRIDPVKYPNGAMDYYLRDIGHIKSVAQAFEIHLRNKQSIRINDHIQLYLDPEPSDRKLNEKIKSLKMSFTRDNATRELILQTSKSYDSIARQIYETAITDNKYVGSDTWRFFKNKVKDYCIDDQSRNILVVLTDGYIYHKDTKLKEINHTTYLTPQDIRKFKLDDKDWQEKITNENFGFIPANSDLTNLEVLVLGINSDKKNPYEEDVIIKYWTDWLENMGISKFEIKVTDLPTNMDKLIKDYILNE